MQAGLKNPTHGGAGAWRQGIKFSYRVGWPFWKLAYRLGFPLSYRYDIFFSRESGD